MIGQNSIASHSSIEAEQGFLGILLAYPETFQEIQGLITENDFISREHGFIFTVIENRLQSGEKVSPVTIKPYTDQLVLPVDYIPDLASCVVSKINVIPYARTISNYAKKRRLIEFLEDMRFKANAATDIESIYSELSAISASQAGESVFARSKRQVQEDVINSLCLPPDCYAVNIPSLDDTMAGGLFAGFTYGFAGAEKSGKTTTAQTISYNLNQTGVKHAYIALEMGSKQIEQRNMARAMGINSIAFLGKEAKGLAKQAANVAATAPDNTVYLDMAGCNFSQIKSEVIKLVSKKQIKGFILDYWQLIPSPDDNKNRSDFLFEIAQWTAAYCRREKVFSVVLSQLNRDGKVLGSAGLERACDQLYILGQSENSWKKGIYMNLTHSRYTPTQSLGDKENPKFEINYKSGPYLSEMVG
jgi:replicative DNA helicase